MHLGSVGIESHMLETSSLDGCLLGFAKPGTTHENVILILRLKKLQNKRLLTISKCARKVKLRVKIKLSLSLTN
jgi:hypothetical protein